MLTLYYHPLASYCWKALIALYEHGAAFEKRLIDLGDAAHRAELSAVWPLCKFPVLRDGERVVVESSIIIEYLDHYHPGAGTVLPRGCDAALEARRWDRLADNYVQAPMQEIVFDRLRGGTGEVSGAHTMLTTAYGLVEQQLASSPWLAGGDFSIADCAAAPALFYAATVQPFAERYPRLSAYFDRLVERPSVRRTLEEARPYFESYPFEGSIAARFR
jgi:glutathione S-transferase